MGICCPDPIRAHQSDVPLADFVTGYVKLRRQTWDSNWTRAGLLGQYMDTPAPNNNRCAEECRQFARHIDMSSTLTRPHSNRR